jgi:hypothetical protein
MNMNDFVVPRDNKELYNRYQSFVARQVRRHDTVGRHFEDLLQAVWLRLLEANILGKFEVSLGRTPLTLTGWEAAAHIGITWDQWKVSQWRTRIGKTDWAPKPLTGKGCQKDATYRTSEVEAVAHHFKRHQGIQVPEHSQSPTRGRFESYLSVAVSNAFKNFCRTLKRKDRDMYLPPLEDGSAWETRLVDDGAAPDIGALLHEALEQHGNPEGLLEMVEAGYTLSEAVVKSGKVHRRTQIKVARQA